MNYKTLTLRFLLLLVAIVAVLFALDGLLTRQRLGRMQDITASPTTYLEPLQHNVESKTSRYTCWHRVTEIKDVTESIDRLLLRRKIEVVHKRFCMFSDNSINIANGTTLLTVNLWGERAVPELFGPGTSLINHQGYPDLPLHAIRYGGVPRTPPLEKVGTIGGVITPPPK